MNNQATIRQISDSFQQALEEAKHPDSRKKNQKIRDKKKKKISAKFGF